MFGLTTLAPHIEPTGILFQIQDLPFNEKFTLEERERREESYQRKSLYFSIMVLDYSKVAHSRKQPRHDRVKSLNEQSIWVSGVK